MFHPFSVSAQGGISVTQNPDKQIAQRVETLLSTEPGERRANYDFGVPTASNVFENQSYLINGALATQVKQKIETFEPGVVVNSLDVSASADIPGGVEVDLNYTRREAPLSPTGIAKNTNTVVIGVGGTVREIVRG